MTKFNVVYVFYGPVSALLLSVYMWFPLLYNTTHAQPFFGLLIASIIFLTAMALYGLVNLRRWLRNFELYSKIMEVYQLLILTVLVLFCWGLQLTYIWTPPLSSAVGWFASIALTVIVVMYWTMFLRMRDKS